MKKIVPIILIFISAFGSDFAISHEQLNDKFNIPTIDKNMSYEEFELLSYTPGIKDIGYALIVPGYIHFKAHDETQGYWNLGLRLTTYATMAATYYSQDSLANETNRGVFNTALLSAIGLFLYDWIHGINTLESKQTHIRYDYAKQQLSLNVPF